jgi:hypothetical protein
MLITDGCVSETDWFLGYLTALFRLRKLVSIKWDGKSIVYSKWIRFLNKAVLAYFNVLYQNSREAKQNHDKTYLLDNNTSFEINTFQI